MACRIEAVHVSLQYHDWRDGHAPKDLILLLDDLEEQLGIRLSVPVSGRAGAWNTHLIRLHRAARLGKVNEVRALSKKDWP